MAKVTYKILKVVSRIERGIMTIRDLMNDEQRKHEDAWAQAKWGCLARYVASLNRVDQVRWSEKQSDKTKERVMNEIVKLKSQPKP
jgi:hypothetical protein